MEFVLTATKIPNSGDQHMLFQFPSILIGLLHVNPSELEEILLLPTITNRFNLDDQVTLFQVSDEEMGLAHDEPSVL